MKDLLAKMSDVFLLRELLKFKDDPYGYTEAVRDKIDTICAPLKLFMLMVTARFGDNALVGGLLAFGWLDHFGEVEDSCRTWLDNRLPFVTVEFAAAMAQAIVSAPGQFEEAARELVAETSIADVLVGLRLGHGLPTEQGALFMMEFLRRIDQYKSGANEGELLQ